MPELAFSYSKRKKPIEIKTNKYGDTGAEFSSHLDPHDTSIMQPEEVWLIFDQTEICKGLTYVTKCVNVPTIL